MGEVEVRPPEVTGLGVAHAARGEQRDDGPARARAAHRAPAVQPDHPGLAAAEPRSDVFPREVLVVATPSCRPGSRRSPALGFGQDGCPALAGAAEPPRLPPTVDRDSEPEARIRAVLEWPDVDRSGDRAAGGWTRVFTRSRHGRVYRSVSDSISLGPRRPRGAATGGSGGRRDPSNAAMASATTFGSNRSRARGPCPSRIAPSSR
jgi:hypothetical protein